MGLRHRKRRKLTVAKTQAQELNGPNQAWCLDFCDERFENGRSARIIGVLDCFTRGCLLLKAATSFPAVEFEQELSWLYLVYGKPAALVSDNGPEFRAMTRPEGVAHRFIHPGKPWQNGYIQSFFGKFRDELLYCELFMRGSELPRALDEFQDHYNNRRPHLGLGGLTPSDFKKALQNTTEDPILYS